MLNKKAFTLIEVLVATLIMFFSILSVSAAYREYLSCKFRQKKYENIYESTLSLLNQIEYLKIKDILKHPEGKINGLKYKIFVKKIISKRNYFYSFNPNQSGNFGDFLITLYKIDFHVAGKNFVFYKTEYKRINK